MAQNVTVGEYYDGGSGGQVVGMGDYFDTTPGGELTGLGARNVTPVGRSPDGLGSLSALSPLVRDLRKVRAYYRANGANSPLYVNASFGQDATAAPADPTIQSSGPSPAAIALGIVVGVGLRGVAGYLVGRELAPSSDRETKYAWWGAAASVVFGTVGLGVQAVVAHRNR